MMKNLKKNDMEKKKDKVSVVFLQLAMMFVTILIRHKS